MKNLPVWLECPVRSVALGTVSILGACSAIFAGMSLVNSLV
ncbi:MAG TPA: hypothetical protein VIS76_15070 [Pseudomonadales bacterium]